MERKNAAGQQILVTVVKGIHQKAPLVNGIPKGGDAHITISVSEQFNSNNAACRMHINLTLITQEGFSHWEAVQVSVVNEYPSMTLASRAHSSVGRRDSVDFSTAKAGREAALEAAEIGRLGAISLV